MATECVNQALLDTTYAYRFLLYLATIRKVEPAYIIIVM